MKNTILLSINGAALAGCLFSFYIMFSTPWAVWSIVSFCICAAWCILFTFVNLDWRYWDDVRGKNNGEKESSSIRTSGKVAPGNEGHIEFLSRYFGDLS